MILVDSNVPMYLVGAAHPHKIDARRFLEQAVTDGRRLVTDTEVLQEILHRYVSINRRDAIQPCFDILLEIVDEVIPINLDTLQKAREVVLGRAEITARDAIHVAVMEIHGISEIVSFDRHFDGVPGVARRP